MYKRNPKICFLSDPRGSLQGKTAPQVLPSLLGVHILVIRAVFIHLAIRSSSWVHFCVLPPRLYPGAAHPDQSIGALPNHMWRLDRDVFEAAATLKPAGTPKLVS
jgi:hypothetical protein